VKLIIDLNISYLVIYDMVYGVHKPLIM